MISTTYDAQRRQGAMLSSIDWGPACSMCYRTSIRCVSILVPSGVNASLQASSSATDSYSLAPTDIEILLPLEKLEALSENRAHDDIVTGCDTQ